MSARGARAVTWERQKVYGLDTNIFIYHFEENPAYVDFTQRLFERIESGRVRAITSTLTLHEILTGAKKAGDAMLAARYRTLLETFPNLEVVPFDAAIADLSSGLRAKYGIRTPDAIQIATALHRGAERFVTNDEGLRRIKEIRVELPGRTA